jgi:hypothetical protein
MILTWWSLYVWASVSDAGQLGISSNRRPVLKLRCLQTFTIEAGLKHRNCQKNA